MTEKEKFFINLEKKRQEQGLLHMSFFPTDVAIGADEEELYAELNRMDEAPTVEDPELLS